jgi:hypothetical protein
MLQHLFYHMEIDLMIIGKARNVLVAEVLTRLPEVEVLWFIDNDVMIPENAGVLIDQAKEYGIVSGLYFNRHLPYTPQAYKLSSRPGEEGMYEPLFDYPEEGLMIVDAVGAGCLCVRRDVFEKMRLNHKTRLEESKEELLYKLRNDGQARRGLEWLLTYVTSLSPWFEFLDQKGEDFYFCEKARDAGFMSFLNVQVKCDHMGSTPINEQHFKYLKDNNMYVRLDLKGNPVPVEAPK